MSAIGRLGALTLALAAALTFMVDTADARAGRAGGFGSRGSRTDTAPSPTTTAPATKPIEKSMTQPGSGYTATKAAPTPTASRFGSGFGGMLLGGLLGAGLFGLLSGSGLFGGLSGIASLFGLLLQGALIAGIVYLVMSYFRARQAAPAYAQAGAGPVARTALGGAMGGGLGGAGSVAQPPLAVGGDDLNAFERLLGEIQGAYSREDIDALGEMVTPEMLSYFSRDIADYKRKGVRNEVTDVKLLQGDLAESWREDGTDYATVAMRFSLRDALVDRTTGQPAGGAAALEEATEVWTFRRDANHTVQDWQRGWQLSAIQQVEE
jgi:predicted lipid-binding transport protein (Tim44 family)